MTQWTDDLYRLCECRPASLENHECDKPCARCIAVAELFCLFQAAKPKTGADASKYMARKRNKAGGQGR